MTDRTDEQRRRRAPGWVTLGLLSLAALFGQADDSAASCDSIPSATRTLRATLGSVNRPFAAPNDVVEIAVRPQVCDASSTGLPTLDNALVTILFVPPNNGPRHAVVLTHDCSGVAACPGTATTCIDADDPARPNQLSSRFVHGERRLEIRFPDTDALLAPDQDQRTFSGPAVLAVERRMAGSPPLACQLANQRCAEASAGLAACIDELFELDGTCATEPANGHKVFSHFTALPPPTSYAALCRAPSPPCTASAPELRFTTDREGNVLVPVDWRGVLVEEDDVPVPRLLSARITLPIRIPGQGSLSSFTVDGLRLPPMFEPRSSLGANSEVVLFGSADAPSSVLRVARRRGRCAAGAHTGDACVTDADCEDLPCIAACAGGSRDGLACSTTADCDGSPCGELFDLQNSYVEGTGPLVLPAGLIQAVAGDPVPLDGISGSDQALALVQSEAVAQADCNGDADQLDHCVVLRQRNDGSIVPLGIPAGCGLSDSAIGRSVARIHTPPFSFPAVALDGDVLAFLEAETDANHCDENQNGTRLDTILRVFRIGQGEISAGQAPPRVVDALPILNGRPLVVSNGRVYYRRAKLREAPRSVQNLSTDPETGATLAVRSDFALSKDSRYVIASQITLHDSSFQIMLWDRDADGNGIFDESGSAATTREMVSVDTGGIEIAAHNYAPAMSDDATVIAFKSDPNGIPTNPSQRGPVRIFVRDRRTQSTEPVGTLVFLGGPELADSPSISGDGRWITFATAFPNTANDTNDLSDVFLYDHQTRITRRISQLDNGAPANGDSLQPRLSPDGRFVFFYSDPTNLPPAIRQRRSRTFTHDRDVDENGVFDEPGSVSTRETFQEPADIGDELFPGLGLDIRDEFVSPDGRFVGFRTVLIDRVTRLVERVYPSGPGFSNAETIRLSTGANAVAHNVGVELLLRAPNTADGNPSDTVLEVFDSDSRTTTTLTAAVDVAIDGDQVAHLGPESTATGSLNRDGDTDDMVVHRVDPALRVENLGLAATAVAVSARHIAAVVSERGEGLDLNGDGDRNDGVAEVYRTDVRSWANTHQAAEQIAFCGERLIFISSEAQQDRDLNGDNDRDDRVLFVYDPESGVLTNVGEAAEEFVCNADVVVFRELEALQGKRDLNGDRDAIDGVLQIYDLASAGLLSYPRSAVTPCRLEACDPRLPYRIVGETVRFLTYECDQGGSKRNGCAAGGTDLNNDGDAADLIVRELNLPRGANLRAASPSTNLAALRVVAATDEGSVATVDPLRGDPIGPGESATIIASKGRCLEPLYSSCSANVPCTADAACISIDGNAQCHRAHGSCGGDPDCPAGTACHQLRTLLASSDSDQDGVADGIDNCVNVPNPGQDDSNNDGGGDDCSPSGCLPVDTATARITLNTRRPAARLQARFVIPLETYNDEPVTLRLWNGNAVLARKTAGTLKAVGKRSWRFVSIQDGRVRILLKDNGPSMRVRITARDWFPSSAVTANLGSRYVTLSIGSTCFQLALPAPR